MFTASFIHPLAEDARFGLVRLLGHVRLVSIPGGPKTRVFRVVEEIGRWSMVDPLTIACFVPVLQFNALIDGHAEPAVIPFAAVVILTTLAVQLFDPRRMWDAVVENR